MTYYEAYSCKRDPFPGTPSKDLYFPVTHQEKTIDDLVLSVKKPEQAITAVLGVTGIGKTTIYYQFRERLKELKNVSVVSVDNSWFTSQQLFMENIAGFLNIQTSDDPTSQILQERIKSFITAKDKTETDQLLILIDEAETIPSFCFELLENLFSENVNANCLQIITFAKIIFKNKIGQYYNLALNVKTIFLPRKFTFSEIAGMLQHNMAYAESNFTIDSLFSKAALRYTYIICKGHPGKAITLCKLILLNIIVQGRSKAGVVLCHQSANEIFPERAKSLVRTRVIGLAAVTAILVIYLTVTNKPLTILTSILKSPAITTISSTPAKVDQRPTNIVQHKSTVVSETKAQISLTKLPPASSETHVADILNSLKSNEKKHVPQIYKNEPLPEFLGEISVFEQETLGDMIRRIYGPYSFNKKNTDTVLKLNPHVKDKHFLSVGDIIKFPRMAVKLDSSAEKSWWINLVSIDKLQDAYRYIRIYANRETPLLVIPSWDRRGNFIFSIFLQKYFADQKEAEEQLQLLSPDIFSTASLVGGLSHDAYYYSETITEKPVGRKREKAVAAKEEVEPSVLVTSTSKKKPAGSTTLSIVKSQSVDKDPHSVETNSSTSKTISELKTLDKKHALTTIGSTPQKSNSPKSNSQSAIITIPKMLGGLTMGKVYTLGHMIRGVYGKDSINNKNIAWLLNYNKSIKNPDFVPPGTMIYFPVKAVNLPDKSETDWWIQIDTFTTLQSAYTYLQERTPKKPWLLIIPTFTNDRIRFNLLLERSYRKEKNARAKLKKLSKEGFSSAFLIEGLSKKHYFYHLIQVK